MVSYTRHMHRGSAICVLLCLAMVLLSGLTAGAQSGAAPIVVGEIRGVINPMTASYVGRTLDRAQQRDAGLVVLTLDTPGGLETAMRDVVQHLLEASVPVVVYVAPQGARATSAGMFILMASHVAAMAPATHVGAAHPVSLGVELDETQAEKAVSDSAALVRSIAAQRGRNVQWAEAAVRENLSLTAAEALDEAVIDLVAADLPALLTALDGRTVAVGGESRTLTTTGAPIDELKMNLAEQALHIISDPNIAYLLLSLGMLFLLAEISEPGLGLGAAGSIIAFVLAFFALGSLPVNWAAVALIIAGVALFVIGLLTDTEVVVTLAGLVPFVLGSLMLFAPFAPSSPAAPTVRVSPWLIAGMSALILLVTFGVLRAAIRATRLPPQSGAQRLIGMTGIALTDLAPTGDVRVDLEQWSATALGEPVQAGEDVVVESVAGVRLIVRRAGDAGGDGPEPTNPV